MFHVVFFTTSFDTIVICVYGYMTMAYVSVKVN